MIDWNGKKVFISGPYTNKIENVYNQITVSNIVMTHGFISFVPLLYHFQTTIYPDTVSYDEWIEFFKHWIKDCDCLLRMSGYSKGADLEVEYALSIGKPVYYSIEELVKQEGKK